MAKLAGGRCGVWRMAGVVRPSILPVDCYRRYDIYEVLVLQFVQYTHTYKEYRRLPVEPEESLATLGCFKDMNFFEKSFA